MGRPPVTPTRLHRPTHAQTTTQADGKDETSSLVVEGSSDSIPAATKSAPSKPSSGSGSTASASASNEPPPSLSLYEQLLAASHVAQNHTQQTETGDKESVSAASTKEGVAVADTSNRTLSTDKGDQTAEESKAELVSTPSALAIADHAAPPAPNDEGNAAIAALLWEKSRELLALASGDGKSGSGEVELDQVLDPATRAQLERDGAQLAKFAQLVQDQLASTSTAASMSSAWSDMWSVLQCKYNSSGSGVQNEALNLWTQLYSSAEAQQLSETSRDLLQQWADYARSEKGLAVIKQSAEALKEQSGAISEMLHSLTVAAGSLLDQTAAASAGQNGSSGVASAAGDGGGSSISSLLAVALSQPDAHASSLAKTTKKVTDALADDEDVKTLLSKITGSGSGSGSAQEEKHGRETSRSSRSGSSYQRSASPFSRSDNESSGSGGDGTQPQPDATAFVSDASDAALKATEEYLRSWRESEIGTKLLSKASDIIKTNQAMLRPDELTNFSATLISDAQARQQFLNKTKDIALEFLLSYLPTVEVPPISGESNNIAYSIENIDLGNFKVESQNVFVTLSEVDRSLSIRAEQISCLMKELQWKYQRLWFPRVGGSGTADANASNVEFILKLKLASPGEEGFPEEEAGEERKDDTEKSRERSKQSESSSRPRSRSISFSGSKSNRPSIPPSPRSDVSATPSRSSPSVSRRSSISHSSRPAAAGSSSHHHSRASSESAAAIAPSAAPAPAPAADSGTASPNTSIAAPADVSAALPDAATATAASSSTSSATVTATCSSSIGSSLLSSVSLDLGEPRLVMESCVVHLHSFTLSLHAGAPGGYLQKVTDWLLTLFSEPIRSYLETTLNEELRTKSTELIKTLNEAAADYLPLLQRIMTKSVNAAMAQDQEEESEEAAVGGEDDKKNDADDTSISATAENGSSSHTVLSQ